MTSIGVFYTKIAPEFAFGPAGVRLSPRPACVTVLAKPTLAQGVASVEERPTPASGVLVSLPEDLGRIRISMR
jgi:hypothetical protein